MSLLVAIVLWVVAIVVAAPMLVVAGQCVVGYFTRIAKPQASHGAARPSCAVLIPAHNEQGVIGRTLATVVPQLQSGDRVVVVADNCSDGTADEARAAGAEVLERHDTVNRGKGFALAAGIAHLRLSPRAVVVLVDADCTVEAGSLDALVQSAFATKHAVQGVFLMYPPDARNVRNVVSAFAFLTKNLGRPLGMHRFRLPVPLTGSGMAFPYGVIRDAKLASGDIVEDLSLGLDLAIAGHGPTLCPSARITSYLPTSEGAMAKQRTRWEHGYLSVLLKRSPQLAVAGLKRRKPKLIAAAIDLTVPPLSLLVMAGVAAFVACAVAGWWFGVFGPAAFVLAALLAMAVGLVLVWARFGRSYLPGRAMLSIPLYVAWKLPIYLRFVKGREKEWVRTARDVPAATTETPTPRGEMGSPRDGLRG